MVRNLLPASMNHVWLYVRQHTHPLQFLLASSQSLTCGLVSSFARHSIGSLNEQWNKGGLTVRNHPAHLHPQLNMLTRNWFPDSVGNGYGFPSSHSQWMAYFATFLICHVHFRHRFSPTGYPLLDYAFRACVILGLLVWSGVVAYSRFFFFKCLWHGFITYLAGSISSTIHHPKSSGEYRLE
jgi:hypothetical protein